MSAPAAATPALRPPALAWRPWVAAASGLVLGTAVLSGAVTGLGGPEAVRTLARLFLYTSVACTFCPLPTAWVFLWAVRTADPFSVALAGALGTCVANLHDYYIVTALCRLGRVQRVRESRYHDDAVRWFHRAPFWTLAAAALLPLPIDFVRMLAISAGYPRLRYALATFTGRLPRYLVLAALGWRFQLSNRTIAWVLALTVVAGLFKAGQHLRERLAARNRAASDAE